jgi:hypothetical protein
VKPFPREVRRKLVRSFKVESLANGTLLVTPDYVPERHELGCAPVGVLTRIMLAQQVQRRLNMCLRERKP